MQHCNSVFRYAKRVEFAWCIGVFGGFSSILTNSMGPLLNIFLITHQVSGPACHAVCPRISTHWGSNPYVMVWYGLGMVRVVWYGVVGYGRSL